MTRSFSSKIIAVTVAILFLAAHGGPAAAQKNAGGAVGPVVNIGGEQIALVVPPGHCALDRRQAADKRVIELVERLLAGRNTLHLTSTDCAELDDWRAGRRATLGEYTQVQHHNPLASQNFRGREGAVLKEICQATQQQGAALAKKVETDIQKRLEAGREQLQLQNVSILGALGEDQNGCYVGMLIKIADETGQPKTQLCVYANVILKGRLVYFYRYSDRLDEAEVQRLLEDRKAIAQAHVAAN